MLLSATQAGGESVTTTIILDGNENLGEADYEITVRCSLCTRRIVAGGMLLDLVCVLLFEAGMCVIRQHASRGAPYLTASTMNSVTLLLE